MAFEAGTQQMRRGTQSLTSPAPAAAEPSEAKELEPDDRVTARTTQDAAEAIRAHYRATAELIAAVYLQSPDREADGRSPLTAF